MDNTTQVRSLPDLFLAPKNFTSNIAQRDPISNEMLHLIHIVMTGIWYSICLTGIVTNIINIRTFVKMGLEDSVTISLFALAISDCSLCSVATVELTSFFVDVLGREYNLFFYLPPLIPALYFMCVRRIFTTSTVVITTFLAIQRCICVALPFYVKLIFNRFRTSCFFLTMFSLDAAVHLLFLSQYPTYVDMDPNTNVSQIGLIVPSSNEPVPFIIEIVIGIGLNIGCQVVVIICLVIMGVMLKKSVRFKKSAQVYSTAKDKSLTSDSAKTHNKGNVKEYQALVQVSLVSIIFVACNLPLFIFGIVNIIVPEIDLYGEYHNLYHFFQNIIYTAELINSSVNLFVYMNYNTKFRKNCFIFPKKDDEKGM